MFGRPKLLSFILFFYFAKGEIRISLDSSEINGTWRVRNGNNSINIEGSVPGGVYSDLQNARILHDNLFYRFNDQAYRWVGKENWTYTAVFEVPSEIFNMSVVNLVFHGVDTVADLCLNGQQIGYVNNMFIRYVIPVKDHLKIDSTVLMLKRRIHQNCRPLLEVIHSQLTETPSAAKAMVYREDLVSIEGESMPIVKSRGKGRRYLQKVLVYEVFHFMGGKNELQVRFKSPIHEAKRLAKKQAEKYKIPPECPPFEQYGECHINFLRKMQASFSWDWGPAFPSVGIWKSVGIEAYNIGIVRDVTVTTTKENSEWLINCTAFIEVHDRTLPYVLIGTIYLVEELNDGLITRSKRIDGVKSYNFTSDMLFIIDERHLELWWPNGYGNQKLYKLTIELGTVNASNDIEIDSVKEINFGVRTIELVQDKVRQNSEGLSFYLKVNGEPIFAKGSNWIPGHILPEMGSEDTMIEHALMSAKEAHMNMLRVWGGGVYESDRFYELADTYGILIWQDMMFAVALYPTDRKFLESVATEIEQQVRRLQHHPSIALWAGNNENEAALSGNWFDTNCSLDLYKRDYVKLYVETVEPIVHYVDSSRSFAVSSPSNGLQSRLEGHIAMNPNSPLFGDVHYYNYEDDPWNASNVINTRFASEYGFQSMPSFSTLSKVSKAEDHKLSSRFIQSRQHHRKGYEEMINLMSYNLPLLIDDGSEYFFKKFIYYSQISQAMSIKTQTEKYRRDRGRLTDENEKFTMGALYWQLNDVWEAPTWSSIEFGGKWKMLHYFATKFFAPVIVSPELTTRDQLDVYVVSDLLHDVPGAELQIALYSWCSFEPKKNITKTICVGKGKSEIHETIALDELLRTTNCTKNTCFVHFSLIHEDFFTDNVLFLSPFSNVPKLEPANVKVKLREMSSEGYALVELTTDKMAPFLWLEADVDGFFTDNGFLLMKERRVISFHNRNHCVDFDRLKKTLKVRSLLS